MHWTYVGRLEHVESGVTVDTLAGILAALRISLAEFFRPFAAPISPRTRDVATDRCFTEIGAVKPRIGGT